MLVLNTPLHSISHVRTHPWPDAVLYSGRGGNLTVRSLPFSLFLSVEIFISKVSWHVWLFTCSPKQSGMVHCLCYSFISLMILHKWMHHPPVRALFCIHLMNNDDCGNVTSNQIIQCSTMLKQWSEAMEAPVLSCYITPIYKFIAVGCLHMLPASPCE